jgi:hypothetical protein
MQVPNSFVDTVPDSGQLNRCFEVGLSDLARVMRPLTGQADRQDDPGERRLGPSISRPAVASLITPMNRPTKGIEPSWKQGGAQALLPVRAASVREDRRAEHDGVSAAATLTRRRRSDWWCEPWICTDKNAIAPIITSPAPARAARPGPSAR